MKHTQSLGTTVIELVLYMLLLSIFLIALFNVFAAILSVQNRSSAVSSVQTNGNYLLAKLSYDINQADSIVTPLSVGDSSASLTLNSNAVNFVYSLNNGYLQENDGTGLYNLNDQDTSISNLVFRRLGNVDGKNGIQINFTLTSLTVVDNASKSANFQTVISPR